MLATTDAPEADSAGRSSRSQASTPGPWSPTLLSIPDPEASGCRRGAGFPAQGPADVLGDSQLAANDGFLTLPADPDGTPRRSINGPVSFSDLPVGQAAPAPLLGQHTEEVLAELKARRRGGEGSAQA